MTDEEDCDDLPPISVNSSFRDSSSFSMPTAGEVASERARAAHCEQQLLRLREEHDIAQAEVAALAHSDSSGSEGEAALSAVVGALRIKTPRRAPPVPPARLLTDCASQLPQPLPKLLSRYLQATEQAPDGALSQLDDEMARVLSEAVTGPFDAWDQEEACGAALWTLAALAAHRADVARLAHVLLEDILDEKSAGVVATAVDVGLKDSRARLTLADALLGGGDRSRELAAQLSRVEVTSNEASARYVALQAAARALAARGNNAPEERRVLTSMLTASRPRDNCPDTLKVIVAATKLRVLFDVAE